MSLEEIAKNPTPLLAEQPDLDTDSFCQVSNFNDDKDTNDDKRSMTGLVHGRWDELRPVKGTKWLRLLPCTSCPTEPGENS